MQPPGSAKALSRGLTQAPRRLPRPIPRYWSRHLFLLAQPHLHQEVSTGWILKHADIRHIRREQPPQFLEMKDTPYGAVLGLGLKMWAGSLF